MTDLIRREDVFKGLWAKHTHHGMGLDALITMEDALDAVVSIPAVDAVEVRHGRWIEDDYGFWRCDQCGYKWDEPVVVPPYCPHCGAKMDGGEKVSSEC